MANTSEIELVSAVIAAGLAYPLDNWEKFMEWMRQDGTEYSADEETYMQRVFIKATVDLISTMPDSMLKVISEIKELNDGQAPV